MKRPVALIGMRCAGKSSVGANLAGRIGSAFVDLDDEVVKVAVRAGLTVGSPGELLEKHGLEVFRTFETEALVAVLEPGRPLVLATGGGVVEREQNRAALARAAICVWIDVPVERLQARLADQVAASPEGTLARPSLTGADPVGELPGLFAVRESLYRNLADCVVSGDVEVDRVAAQIEAALEDAE